MISDIISGRFADAVREHGLICDRHPEAQTAIRLALAIETLPSELNQGRVIKWDSMSFRIFSAIWMTIKCDSR
jgi:hypothetical protein